MGPFNIPNILTLFRMIASFGVLYYGLEDRWNIAFPIFCVAAATDMIDGTVARVLGQRTRLGGFLDPVADKLLMFLSIVSLTGTGFIPYGLAAVIIARDLFIGIGLLILQLSHVTVLFRPTYLSKLTTFSQISVILLALIATQKSLSPVDLYGTLWGAVVGTTALLTVVTGFQYGRIGYRMLHS